jgi:SAM-dependent methyltransferase
MNLHPCATVVSSEEITGILGRESAGTHEGSATRTMWDQRYSEPGFAYGTAPNEFLAANAERYIPANGDVLCLGDGEGRNAVFLARIGFRVTGVDGSAVGLEKARALAEQNGVEIQTVVADLAQFDLGALRWDGIVSIWCHTPSALRTRLHHSVVAALRPGGVLLLESYRPEQLEYRTGGPPIADMTMTLAGARVELAGLELLQAEEKIREVHEGRYHDGASAVLQVIARKP